MSASVSKENSSSTPKRKKSLQKPKKRKWSSGRGGDDEDDSEDSDFNLEENRKEEGEEEEEDEELLELEDQFVGRDTDDNAADDGGNFFPSLPCCSLTPLLSLLDDEWAVNDYSDSKYDVVFEGGFSIPEALYNKLFDYQRTGR
jgi:hypothetical protein